MSVEIHQPKIQSIIDRQMATGAFRSVEELLLCALQSFARPEPDPQEIGFGRKLVSTFGEAGELLEGWELDLQRDSSPGRVVDLG